MMENSFCVKSIISVLLVLIICVFIGIPYKDTLVIIILASLFVFLYHMLILYDNNKNKYKNSLHNLNITFNNKSLNNKNEIQTDNKANNNSEDLDNNEDLNNNKLEGNIVNNTEWENKNNRILKKNGYGKELDYNNNLPHHLNNSQDNIINAEMYNLEDCTTDKSCIQNPDVNNLFTGYDNEVRYLDPKINKPKNELKNMNQNNNGVLIENFEDNVSPEKLNDIVSPFNNTIIKPFHNLSEDLSDIRTKEQKNMDMDDMELCYHGKIGHCEGGVCKDIEELKRDAIEEVVEEINKMSETERKKKRYHPFSINFPTVRTTNNELIQ